MADRRISFLVVLLSAARFYSPQRARTTGLSPMLTARFLSWPRTASRSRRQTILARVSANTKDQFCAAHRLRVSANQRKCFEVALASFTTHLTTRDTDRISARIIPLSTTSTSEQNLGIPSVAPISAGSPMPDARRRARWHRNPRFWSVLHSFSPMAVNAQGLNLQGLQFPYQTPLTISVNATVQRALTIRCLHKCRTYIPSGNHLQMGPGNNNVT